jgi:hypothetical protein
MIAIKKGEHRKEVADHRLQEFLDAGWELEIQASDEVVRLKPAAKTFAKPAVKEEQGNDQTNIQGE